MFYLPRKKFMLVAIPFSALFEEYFRDHVPASDTSLIYLETTLKTCAPNRKKALIIIQG